MVWSEWSRVGRKVSAHSHHAVRAQAHETPPIHVQLPYQPRKVNSNTGTWMHSKTTGRVNVDVTQTNRVVGQHARTAIAYCI